MPRSISSSKSISTLKLVEGEESSSWEIDETIAQGVLSLNGKGYAEFEETITFEAGTKYVLIINADNEVATFEINGSLDKTVANATIAKIEKIGKVEYNDYCYALIYLARNSYDKLTENEKSLISEKQYKVLTDAEETYAKLKAEGDKAAADNVIALINAIGTVEYTFECKELIDIAREAYDDLIDDQKALISAEQYKVLTDAEAEYKRLEGVVTGINNADAANAMKDGKYIQNGMIIIVKNGKQYNAQGHIIK